MTRGGGEVKSSPMYTETTRWRDRLKGASTGLRKNFGENRERRWLRNTSRPALPSFEEGRASDSKGMSPLSRRRGCEGRNLMDSSQRNSTEVICRGRLAEFQWLEWNLNAKGGMNNARINVLDKFGIWLDLSRDIFREFSKKWNTWILENFRKSKISTATLYST